ncbi:hypothetical protein D6825_00880 [Candidatus Woesearchaeota archaeon]|nr:MAG: hypothetical protein D6825_00880 [Candidatus Woesearchaeota archaeon]
MKVLTVVLLLSILLVACAPALPARKAATGDDSGLSDADAGNASLKSTQPSQSADSSDEGKDEAVLDDSQPSDADDNSGDGSSTPSVSDESKNDLPKKKVVEGDLVSFPNLKATDPDGDPITYTFTSPLDDEGKWQTEVGDAGEYVVTITASDGFNTVSQDVLLIVDPKNKPPIIGLEGPVVVREGETLRLDPKVSDPDGDEVSVTYSGYLTSPIKELSFDDAGEYKVLIVADDGESQSNKTVVIKVENVNRPPVIEELSPVNVKENERVLITPKASDPDGDEVRFIFDEPLDENGAWTTKVGDAGEYELTVTATDGDLSSKQTVSVVVEALNRPPVIELESPIEVNEGETVTLSPSISDPEGDDIKVTYSGWMTSKTKETGYDDAGNHKVVITAEDSQGNQASLEVIVSVKDVNRPPVFGAGSFI